MQHDTKMKNTRKSLYQFVQSTVHPIVNVILAAYLLFPLSNVNFHSDMMCLKRDDSFPSVFLLIFYISVVCGNHSFYGLLAVHDIPWLTLLLFTGNQD